MSNVILTRPAPTVWQVTLNRGPDNRLHPDLLNELAAHLDTVEAEWRESGGGKMEEAKKGKGAGALVITSAFPKFFSNGLDPSSLGDVGGFFENVYDPVFYRLLTFPLITVAAVNGHAFAGGMMLALACDFRVMNADKGMMSMNEIFIGLPLPNSFATFLRLRLPYQALRDTVMGRRWVQSELLENGIIDETAPGDKVLERAIELAKAEAPKVCLGTWGAIKDGMYHEVIDASRSNRQVAMPTWQAKTFWDRVKREKAKAKL